MKILMTTDTVGGVWSYSLELCRAMREYEVEIHLVAMGAWPSKEQRNQISAFENVTLYKSDFKLEWMEEPWEDVEKSRKWINCIYNTVQPDLVHFNNYAQCEEDWTCPVITVFHSCVTTWWQAVKGTELPSSWDTYSQVVKKSLNTSDVVVSPTHKILEKAIAAHGITTATKVINNGKDIEFENTIEKEDIILCTGRIWDEGKNLKLLSEIAESLPWQVFIAGNNIHPTTGKVCEVENVQFLGKLQEEEVLEWVQRASVFVSPSRYEPFGMAILEAAKAGCALALSDIETLQELWSDAAVFFNPENPDEARNKILQLIKDEEFRKDLVRRSLERTKKYTAKRMASEYFELYNKLVSIRKTELIP